MLEMLRAAGEQPYEIPVGGSSGVGVLGYTFATRAVDQLSELGEQPTRLYFASGSRGTQAGLTSARCGVPPLYAVCGIAVSGAILQTGERCASPTTRRVWRPSMCK